MTARQRFNPIDRFLRARRARFVTSALPEGSRVLDVGCGLENWLIRTTSQWNETSLGIDPDLEERYLDERGRRATVEEIAEAEPGGFDAVTSLAVIEHLPVDAVGAHLAAIAATLRPGGRLLLTTPTPRSKPLLEFLAFRLHLISAHEIRDHRHYWSRDELVELLGRLGWAEVEHRSFQIGCNQRVLARRAIGTDTTTDAGATGRKETAPS